jgi:hypothetical protein
MFFDPNHHRATNSSTNVLHGHSEVERAPLVRSFDSPPNDKINGSVTAKTERQHQNQRRYDAASPPSSTTVISRPSMSETASRGRSILEYYTQTMPLSAACQSIQKRCSIVGCAKISVSRGLCRGHGGGRRCHFKGGCTKSAQSRSMFCWAHGGGQRCDVLECMRSRKSKRFCVAHLHLEQASPDNSSTEQPRTNRTNRTKKTHPRMPLHAVDGDASDAEQWTHARTSCEPRRRLLPSLRQALTDASRTLPNLPRRAPRAFC